MQLAVLFQQQMVDALGSPPGFLPRQDYLLVWEFQFLMVVTVGAGEEVFKVHGQDRIQQRFMGQNTLTFQFLKLVAEGGLLGLRPDPNSAASSAHSPGAANEVFTQFFRTFSRGVKVRRWVRTRGRN